MDKRNLNLSSLLKSLRSSTFARHPQQLGLVDACLNLVEAASSPPPTGGGSGMWSRRMAW